MKKLLFGIILLGVAILFPIPTMAGVNIGIGISLPPPIMFNAPPHVVVMPYTYDVYFVPDIDMDLFFWNGSWWRLWGGHWYRSHYYDRGWAYYNAIPSFYCNIDPGWRSYYKNRNWYGDRWNYKKISYQELQRNWKSWHNNRYWERERTWDVQRYKPQPQQQTKERSHQRQEQYKPRSEVQRDLQRFEKERQPKPQPQHSQAGNRKYDHERQAQDRGDMKQGERDGKDRGRGEGNYQARNYGGRHGR